MKRVKFPDELKRFDPKEGEESGDTQVSNAEWVEPKEESEDVLESDDE